MHPSSLIRMEWFKKSFLNEKGDRFSVLDVGSYDVNGSYKQYFDTKTIDYIGLDMANGPNVDIVPEAPYDWKEIKDDSFDVVISGQALEHIEFFWITVQEMARVLKKGGLLCIIAPNGFPEHRHPVDCFRFFTDGMIALARYVNFEVLHAHTNCAPAEGMSEWYSVNAADAMLVARKPYAGPAQLINPATYQCVPSDLAAARQHFVPAPPRQKKKRLLRRLLGK